MALSCFSTLKGWWSENEQKYIGISKYIIKVNYESIEQIKQSKFLNVVNKVISKLTGYKIENIDIKDKFQEDLGIDSIKKADIIFSILEETGTETNNQFNTNDFQSVFDFTSFLENTSKHGDNAIYKDIAETSDFKRHYLAWTETKIPFNLPDEYAQNQDEFLEIYVDDIINNPKKFFEKIDNHKFSKNCINTLSVIF